MASQLDRLFVQLNNTALQRDNPRLFQLLNQLIGFLQGIETQLNTRIEQNNTDITQKTFLTSVSEIATLPNSRELIAGTNITFDDTVAGIKTLNVPSMSTPPGGVDGDYQYKNGAAFAGGAVKRINSGRTDIKDGVTAQELRLFNTESGAGANYELIKLLGGQLDIFSEPCFSFIADSAGTGVPQGIEFKTVGTSISFRIAGNFPAMILYHDPTSNGGISLIPNNASFIGTIFCDQSGSIMWTPGGFATPHMIELLTASAKALLIGHTTAGADFTSRFLNFDTTNNRIEVGNNPAGGGTGSSRPVVFDAATNGLVANLPAGPTGSILYVTNALAPAIGANVVGGGAAKALVWYNGANWTVIGV
jgi:hypothetical protein